MTVLALDIATKTGWAMTGDMSGVWDLSTKRDESSGMKLIRFRSKLTEVFEAVPIDLIVYEKPAGFHKAALIHAARLVGILQLFCLDKGIEYREYSATEIKKFATGKGNANKLAMVAAAEKRWEFNIIDDNHADALWLLELALKDLMI